MKINQLTRCLVPIVFIGFLVVANAGTARAQTKRLAPFPASDVYIQIMNQPGNPLLITNPRVYYDFDKKRANNFSFGVLNVGKKSIVGFQVACLWDTGSGGTLETSWNEIDSKRILRPGQQIDEVDPERFASVPFSQELRDTLKFKSSPGRLLFYLVYSVRFEDGTKLEFHDQLDNLSSFLANNYWDKSQ